MKYGYNCDEDIAALATANAPSALALIRTSGKTVYQRLARLFSRPEALLNAEGNTVVYGWLLLEDGSHLDEVVIMAFRAPASYTGEDNLDICIHGGNANIKAVLHRLEKAGFRTALGGEFTFRAFMNGKRDLLKSEAVQEIVAAKTESGRALAQERLSGTLSKEISRIKNELVHVLAGIEIQLDYAEDDDIHDDEINVSGIESCLASVRNLLSSYASQKLYQDGYKVALVGKTNAGKSSLFNLFLKEDRAIVSDIHGTTRDYLEAWVDVLGLPVLLYDTAGLRETQDAIEKQGIKRTELLAHEADLVLYIIDGSAELSKEDREAIESLKNQKHIIVMNKIDKVSLIDAGKALLDCVNVSALTAFGFKELEERILSFAFGEVAPGKRKVSAHEVSIAGERQKEALERTEASLVSALEANTAHISLDLIAPDISEAINALGELTGEVSNADLLEVMFSDFCVGK